MDNWTFRLATLHDLGAVSKTSKAAYIPAYEPLIGMAPRPATEDYTSWITKGLVWLAEHGERAVGVLVLEDHVDFLMIWSIAVTPDFQGMGLGKSLLDHAEKIAHEMGTTRLRLHTNTKMTANVALYRKAGFKEIYVRPHPIRKGHQLIHMGKDVQDPVP